MITTSNEAGIWPRADYADKTPGELARDFSSDQQQRIIAALVQGPFNSAFTTISSESADGATVMTQSQGQPQVFVIADSDWLFDPFALQVVEVDGQALTRPLNDNLALLAQHDRVC